MAIAFMPPQEREIKQRNEDKLRRLRSVDPVTRWNAREEIFNDACMKMGKNLVQQAEQTGKAFQRQLEHYEQSERENSKYKRINHNDINKQ